MQENPKNHKNTSYSPCTQKSTPHNVSAHGMTWEDPYHWMKQTDDPDFIKYVHQENSYADAFMANTKHLQRTLYSEMIGMYLSYIYV